MTRGGQPVVGEKLSGVSVTDQAGAVDLRLKGNALSRPIPGSGKVEGIELQDAMFPKHSNRFLMDFVGLVWIGMKARRWMVHMLLTINLKELIDTHKQCKNCLPPVTLTEILQDQKNCSKKEKRQKKTESDSFMIVAGLRTMTTKLKPT